MNNKDISISLVDALCLCFDAGGYKVAPNDVGIDKNMLLTFLASGSNVKRGALGLSSNKWTKFIFNTFPDKPRGSKSWNWLLLKQDLLFCGGCASVKNISNFCKNKNNVTGFQRHCKKCQMELNKKTQNYRQNKYRAAKLNATVLWAEEKEIRSFYINCPEGYHVDHIIPLQGTHICGLHVLSNLQYLPAAENSSKRNKFHYWWE